MGPVRNDRGVMRVSVRRISIQTELADGSGVGTFDVALCARTSVGELMPAVVALLDAVPLDLGGHWWRLDRPVGTRLEESLSLTDNDVHDGDLLVLIPEHAPPLGVPARAAARTVATADESSALPDHAIGTAVFTCAAVAAAVALALAGGAGTTLGHLVVAAVGAVTASAVAVLRRSAGLAGAGAALAAAAGLLAVPAGPTAHDVLLAAAAAFTSLIVVGRLTEAPSPTLTAMSTATGSATVAASCAVFGTADPTTVGAVLVIGSLSALAVAPRLAAWSAGLGPPGGAASSATVEARARRAHQTVTGVASGCATAVAAGAALVTFGCLRSDTAPAAGAAFLLATTVVVLMRVRTYVDAARRVALLASGLGCAAAVFAVLAAALPDRIGWLGAAALTAGLLALRRWDSTPGLRRAADVLDCVAVASLIPLACWATGVYTAVRNWPLA